MEFVFLVGLGFVFWTLLSNLKYKRLQEKREFLHRQDELNQINKREQKKNIQKLNYEKKISTLNSGKIKIPTSDLAIKKSDRKARYLLKVFKYVRHNEPKFDSYNWSNAYKREDYNEKIISYLVDVFGYVCCYCGKKLNQKTLTLDHIMPRQSGGSNRISNILLACRTCNSTKGANTVGQFIVGEYLAGKEFAPWVISLLKNKIARNIIKKI